MVSHKRQGVEYLEMARRESKRESTVKESTFATAIGDKMSSYLWNTRRKRLRRILLGQMPERILL